MTDTDSQPLDAYLRDIARIRATGAATKETSYYPALSGLFNRVGDSLKTRVHVVINPKNQGGGIPDGGLYLASSLQKLDVENPLEGHKPERGALEVKAPNAAVEDIARTDQVSKYLEHYGQVLVTNLRDFLLVTRNTETGEVRHAERYTIATSAEAFWDAANHPRDTADQHGALFSAFLQRVLRSGAPLLAPADVAWYLASYAREARVRLDRSGSDTLPELRKVLEQALGVTYTGEEGRHFFVSTLVQTLFYGLFSGWVLWHRDDPDREDAYSWKETDEYLRVPMLYALFERITGRHGRQELLLDDLLERTTRTLNRIDRTAFFTRFNEQEAVQYFYEPFLEAFDPELREELGVWYTPREVVRYMVERVDRRLRDDFDIPDGLADPNVYVLDPCCGTGAYVVEVLNRIERTLRERGETSMVGLELKEAASERVFGFELLTASFVIAHLQIGLRLDALGVPFRGDERASVYLTNALTGWEPPDEPQTLLFAELQEEREAADRIKRDTPILVILGNPPYYGFAKIAPGPEERQLSDAYRTTQEAPPPEGQGLNDPYVRFFRIAERQIAEHTGRGIVSYISNYGWLHRSSHNGMREHYLQTFDEIAIDSLNGDSRRTKKKTPDGKPDPSIFSTTQNPMGIQVGTAITSLIRRNKPTHGTDTVCFRNLWGARKRQQLLEEAQSSATPDYDTVEPSSDLGFPFRPRLVTPAYLTWPSLPDLFPTFFSGVQTCRDQFVIDIDRPSLEDRVKAFFDQSITDPQMAEISPRSMQTTSGYDAPAVRRELQARGYLPDHVIRHAYRPFDVRWLYWEPETKLLDRKREEYFPHAFPGNRCLVTVKKARRQWDPPQLIQSIGSRHLEERGAAVFPMRLHPPTREGELFDGQDQPPEPNISEGAASYLRHLDASHTDLFYHALATLHAVEYRDENLGALHQSWPRVPLPTEAESLASSAGLGRRLADLLDVETDVAGVTQGKPRRELLPFGHVTHETETQLDPARGDFRLEDWGYVQSHNGAVFARGRTLTRRPYTEEELEALEHAAHAAGTSLEDVLNLLGEHAVDVPLNDSVQWEAVPERAWTFTLGGYPVLRKWLSYRDTDDVLGRPLDRHEVRHFTQMVRRILAILLLQPELSDNYDRVVEATFDFSS